MVVEGVLVRGEDKVSSRWRGAVRDGGAARCSGDHEGSWRLLKEVAYGRWDAAVCVLVAVYVSVVGLVGQPGWSGRRSRISAHVAASVESQTRWEAMSATSTSPEWMTCGWRGWVAMPRLAVLEIGAKGTWEGGLQQFDILGCGSPGVTGPPSSRVSIQAPERAELEAHEDFALTRPRSSARSQDHTIDGQISRAGCPNAEREAEAI